jgi:hypothetical protein
MIFNDFSKVLMETLKHIYRGTLALLFRITDRSLLHGKHPGQNAIKAM